MSHSRQHGHSGKPKCVNRCPGRVNFACCGHVSALDNKYDAIKCNSNINIQQHDNIPSMSTSLIMSITSRSVGVSPSFVNTFFSSSFVIFPSRFSSNRLNASLNSGIWNKHRQRFWGQIRYLLPLWNWIKNGQTRKLLKIL